MGFNEQILYELWGWDTFSSESYYCGSYETRAEAEAAKARKEEETWKHQSEGLRDSYWISEITPTEVEGRERELERRIAYEAKDRAYSCELLEKNVSFLVDQLAASLKQDIEALQMAADEAIDIAPMSFKRDVHMTVNTPGDCITFLSIGTRWTKEYGRCWLRYNWEINCETVRSTGCECEKVTPHHTIADFAQWLSTETAPKEIAQYIADSLQKEFWRS